MAPVVPHPKEIRGFRDEAAFEKWLRANHDRETALWLKIYKKSSGVPTVTYAQALDVALCWGWVDGLKKSFDEDALYSASRRDGRRASGTRSTASMSRGWSRPGG